ncbi:TonB-dependent siderophore receptor [Allopusillimonas ginsengisoli]|uniref:TonB-dependent siderophore receptor n=1 Tax=Allopusillimonas ginsengisoli TaxID=453575 RepID=UPI00101E94F6|nr:TonB-dependent receptor [Allopusillimonas ginsengisoli]TEA79990.1 TonB-dependent receptor [Allopusillimonas ginsengisoli]
MAITTTQMNMERQIPLRLLTPLATLIVTGFSAGQSALARDVAPSARAVPQLPEVSVIGTREDHTLQHLQSPVLSGALGTRSKLETPFSSTVIISADIKERQVNKLGDVFMTDASVSDNSAAYGAWANYLTVRGLPLDWQNSFRIDGKPFMSYATTLPYEQFERVDLLKGATGFMYGFGSPGGLVNYVTKKPTNGPVRDVTVGYQSKNLWHESVDLGGRTGDNDRFGYRLNATHQEGTLYNNSTLNRNSVSLALDARLTDRLTWDFQSIYQDIKASDTEPTIYTGLLTGHNLPSAVRNDNGRLVGDGTHFNNAFRFYSTGLKYKISPDWTLSTSYSQSSTQTRRNEEVVQFTDELGNYNDIRSDYGEAYQFNFWQAMLQGRVQTGAIQHDIVAGASQQSQKNDYAGNGFYQQIGTGTLSMQNTNTYQSVGTIHSLGMFRGAEIAQKAIFASDTVQLSDRWSILGGLRYTNYDQKAFGPGGAQTSSYNKNGVLTPTAALMYKLMPQTMAYASYIESLEQGSSVGSRYANHGAQLDPIKSRQYEIGIKSVQERLAATAALFRVERKTEYPNVANEIVQDGLSVYQGAEVGASMRLGSYWDIGGEVMLLNATYEKGADNIGNRVVGAPKVVATTQVSYRVPQIPGLKLMANAKYTSSTMLRPSNDVEMDSYAVFNVGASYETTVNGYDTTLRLAAHNITNQRYWTYQYADYIKASDPRSISLTATAQF